MYRQIIAFLLLFAFMLQTFSKTFIVAGYFTNTKAYAKNCENKAKPKMRCNGKCQMMKKLKQEEKKDEQNPQRKIENEYVLSSKSFYPSLKINITPKRSAFLVIISTGRAVKRSYPLLRPPIC